MRFVTWNMLGGVNTQYIAQVVNQTGANVLCLQECGNLGAHLQAAVAVPGHAGSFTGNLVVGHGFMECIYWSNAGWTQGGLAVLTNIGSLASGIMAAAAAAYAPPIPRNLPWMRVNTPAGQITVYSIHAPPVWGGVTVANVCGWSNAQITAVNAAVAGNWAVMGDFNADPTQVGFIAPPVGAVVRGVNATQQGAGLLDYTITNAGAGFTFQAAGILAGASDHYPQSFNF